MASYPHHRRLVSLICEMADVLASESEQFHRAAVTRRGTTTTTPAVEQATEWLRHAFRAMTLGITTLREADEYLQQALREDAT